MSMNDEAFCDKWLFIHSVWFIHSPSKYTPERLSEHLVVCVHVLTIMCIQCKALLSGRTLENKTDRIGHYII